MTECRITDTKAGKQNNNFPALSSSIIECIP